MLSISGSDDHGDHLVIAGTVAEGSTCSYVLHASARVWHSHVVLPLALALPFTFPHMWVGAGEYSLFLYSVPQLSVRPFSERGDIPFSSSPSPTLYWGGGDKVAGPRCQHSSSSGGGGGLSLGEGSHQLLFLPLTTPRVTPRVLPLFPGSHEVRGDEIRSRSSLF